MPESSSQNLHHLSIPHGNHHNMSFDQEILLMYDQFEKIGLQCLDGIQVLGFWVFPILIILSQLLALAIEKQEYLFRFLFWILLAPFSSSTSNSSNNNNNNKIIKDENNNNQNNKNNSSSSEVSEATSPNKKNRNLIILQKVVDDLLRDDDEEYVESNSTKNTIRSSSPASKKKASLNVTSSATKPKHIAVIMDGNRRYGKEKLGSALLGHRVGGEKLREFVRWCRKAEIEMLTVYAFSTENWNRPQQEVDVLMDLFSSFFQQMLIDAEEIGIRIRFMSSEPEKLPSEIRELMRKVEKHTRQFGEDEDTEENQRGKKSICVNVCASYGSRSALVKASHRIATSKNNENEHQNKEEDEEILLKHELAKSFLELEEEQQEQDENNNNKKKKKSNNNKQRKDGENENVSSSKSKSNNNNNMTRKRDVELWSSPDVLIRTSGEVRISNFMLFELAYTEMFFWDCSWPEVTQEMLNDCLDEFSQSRQRRMGK